MFIHGQISQNMKDIFEMDYATATENGFLTIETQRVTNIRGNIVTTKRVDLDCTNGKTAPSTKDNF